MPYDLIEDRLGGEDEFSSSINGTVQLCSIEFDANSEFYYKLNIILQKVTRLKIFKIISVVVLDRNCIIKTCNKQNVA